MFIRTLLNRNERKRLAITPTKNIIDGFQYVCEKWISIFDKKPVGMLLILQTFLRVSDVSRITKIWPTICVQ